MLFLHDKDQQ